MINKSELLELGEVFYKKAKCKLIRAKYDGQNVVVLKVPKSQVKYIEANSDRLKQSSTESPSVLKVIDIILNVEQKGNFRLKHYVVIENFSNHFYHLLADNKMPPTLHCLVNWAHTLSRSGASLINKGHIPVINYFTAGFNEEWELKLFHPSLVEAMVPKNGGGAIVSEERYIDNIQNLFRAPESFNLRFIKNEASSVYGFGIFLLYITLGNLDFLNKTTEEFYSDCILGKHPAVPDNLPKDIKELIENCTHKDHLKRPKFAEIEAILGKLQEQLSKNSHEGMMTLQQEKNSLFSKVPDEMIHGIMNALGLFGQTKANKMEPTTIGETESNSSAPLV